MKKSRLLISIIIMLVILLLIISIIKYSIHISNSSYINNTTEDLNNDENSANDLPPMIHYDDKDYQMYDCVKGIDIASLKLIGQITNTVDLSTMPTKNLETNCNYMGLNVYKYNGNELLVEYPEGNYNLFRYKKL